MVVASVGSEGETSTHIPIEVSALGKGIAYNVLINLFPKVDGTTAITGDHHVPQLAAGLAQQTELRKDLENCDPAVIHRHRCMSRDAGIVFRNWSGARDLNPGPHGPEPWSRHVLTCPAGSFTALLNSIATPMLSSCYRSEPSGSGNA
jgi:hypothetical protein